MEPDLRQGTSITKKWESLYCAIHTVHRIRHAALSTGHRMAGDRYTIPLQQTPDDQIR